MGVSHIEINKKPASIYPQSNGSSKAGVVDENPLFGVVDWRFFCRRSFGVSREAGRVTCSLVARGNGGHHNKRSRTEYAMRTVELAVVCGSWSGCAGAGMRGYGHFLPL